MLPSRLRALLVPFASLTFTFLVGAPVVARSRTPAPDIMPRPAPVAPAYAVTDLGVLPGYTDSAAYAINARGQVVGAAYVPGLRSSAEWDRAFRTPATGTLATPGADLGNLPGGSPPFSEASGINAYGQAVGDATAADSQVHAFRLGPAGTLAARGVDLGTLPGDNNSEALAINGRSQVVGDAYDTRPDGREHRLRAFLYDDAARPRLRDLNSLIPAHSGVVLERATGINDAGQIAAIGTVHGHEHVFRLTPLHPDRAATTATTPEATAMVTPTSVLTTADAIVVGTTPTTASTTAPPVAPTDIPIR